ncbi:rap guanine nucleotide exchange factor 1-like isoform X1 [Amphiura filiformis]|uniref:rap guanine nucleotide exchange factor 1-like isoform X1 n=1 Tax=Amphiura filiformis TaxID=82378 RepID=UPI003B215472
MIMKMPARRARSISLSAALESTAYKFNTLPRLGKKKKTSKVKESKDDIGTDTPKTEPSLRPKSQRRSAFEMTRRKLSRGSRDHTPVSFDAAHSHKGRVSKDVDKLQGSEKAVMVALKWFLDVVQKDILIMLPGSTTKVLQEVMELNQQLNTCLNHEESSVLSSRHNQVYQALAKLIHWADRVVLYGTDAMDKGEGSVITEEVKTGIKELVDMYVEKLKARERRMSADLSSSMASHTTSSAPTTPKIDPKEEPDEAPPLPPKKLSGTPGLGGNSSPGIGGSTPSMTSSSTPSSNRTSVYDNEDPIMLTPGGNDYYLLDRSISGSSVSVKSHQSDLSSGSAPSRPESMYSSQFSSMLGDELDSGINVNPDASSRLSMHSVTSTSSSEHPDKLSNDEGSAFSDGAAPELPVKNRPRVERKLSQYDNLSPDEAPEVVKRCENLQEEEKEAFFKRQFFQCSTSAQGAIITTQEGTQLQVSHEMMKRISREITGITPTDDEPPPLPPKGKHINAYLDLLGGYTEDQFRMTYYQASCNGYQGFSEHHDSMGEYIQRREQFFQETSETYLLRQHHHTRMSRLRRHASDGHYSDDSHSDSNSDSLETPPSLPGKRKEGTMQTPDLHRLRLHTNPEKPSHPMHDVKRKCESMVESSHHNNHVNTPESSPVHLPSHASTKESESTEEEEESSEPSTLQLLDTTHLLLYSTEEEGNPIKGGPVEALIVYACDADRKDLVYYEAFLSTYRMFISPNELLSKLLNRYKRFRHKPDMKCKRANRNAFFLLLRVAGELLGQVEDDILKMLMDLVFQLLCDGELMLAKILRDKVLTKIEDNKKAALKAKVSLPAMGVSTVRTTLWEFGSQQLAEQMTIQDSELFQKIEIAEVLLWAKEQSEELSPNLTIFTEHFNKMSFWVRSMILQEQRPDMREKIVTKFIKVMRHLRKLNNFNSYLAVLSALDSAPIRRLEWQEKTVEGLKEYCTLIDSSSSFRTYRAALADADPPCIPYLGLILQDITFVHIGNPDFIPGLGDDKECINFVKCWQYFNILDSMRRFKQHHYDTLKKDQRVLAFFDDFNNFIDEEAMWQLSKEIKPSGRGTRAT